MFRHLAKSRGHKVVFGAIRQRKTSVIRRWAFSSKAKGEGGSFSAWEAAAAITVVLYGSWAVRYWRNDEVERLPLADQFWQTECPDRSLPELIEIVQRAGLMGRHSSVKDELDDIRAWHTEHGYKGGLVVRDLTKPVFSWGSADDDDDQTQQHEEHWKLDLQSLGRFIDDPIRLARRECYYLYYELEATGRITQQIFCRGTTLKVDILTCLQSKMVYDDDFQCRVHKGFRDQADRVLQDVLPLLAPPGDRRATIELCGHSLGGAVASLLAARLKKLGYNVSRVTTIAEPAYVQGVNDAHELRKLLPKDLLRIEDDQDFVPFLPPFGDHVGSKLWLLSKAGGGKARFVDYIGGDKWWTDSFWVNFRVPEILLANGKPHRIPSYLQRLAAIEPTVTSTATEREV